MQLSEDGLAFIARWEGFVGHVYPDVAGKPTIGYGHLINAGEHFGTLTEPDAKALLRIDALAAERTVSRCVKISVGNNAFDAMVSLAYNIGSGAFESSTLLRMLNAGDFGGAADQFKRWIHSGGACLTPGVCPNPPCANGNDGLVNRRAAERALFLKDAPAIIVPEEPMPEVTTTRGQQQALVEIGYHIDVDGDFGPATKVALEDFQRTHGLKVDHDPGPATRAALLIAVAAERKQPAPKGDPVRAKFVEAAHELVGLSANTGDAHKRLAYINAIAPGESWPRGVEMAQMSGCGLTVAAVWRAAGVDDHALAVPYVTGTAISRLVGLAHRAGAWVPWSGSVQPQPGDMVLIDGQSLGEHVYTVVAASLAGFDTVEGGQRDAAGYQCIVAKHRTWAGHNDGGRTVVGWIDCTKLPRHPDTDPTLLAA